MQQCHNSPITPVLMFSMLHAISAYLKLYLTLTHQIYQTKRQIRYYCNVLCVCLRVCLMEAIFVSIC
jgi:hypothetical protein